MKAGMMFRSLAALVCAAMIHTGCVTTHDEPVDPKTEAAAHGGQLATLVAALQGQVGGYDESLGTLTWDDAFLEHVEDRGYDVVVVPIAGSRQRVLAARVEAGGRAPTFTTAIVDFALDPETDQPIVLGVRELDGTQRILLDDQSLGGSCYENCIGPALDGVASFCNPIPVITTRLKCMAAGAIGAAAGCALHCFWDDIWDFLF